MTALSRRRFLVLAGGTVLVAACGGGDDGDEVGVEAGSDGTLPDEVRFRDASAAVVSSDLHARQDPQRLAIAIFALTDDEQPFASGLPARVAIFPPDEPTGDPTWLEPELLTAGLPERRGVYRLDLELREAGIWQGLLEYDGEQSEFFFTVKDAPEAPVEGTAAPTVATATTDDPLDVGVLCTRNPPCDLHAVSLADVVGAGMPVAVQFSTPARCETQYCGPTLDTLLELVPEYEDRVALVHVEIYPDLESPNVVDAVGPDGWDLPSEPWMYGIDAEGTIVERLDGAFAADEVRALLDGLVD